MTNDYLLARADECKCSCLIECSDHRLIRDLAAALRDAQPSLDKKINARAAIANFVNECSAEADEWKKRAERAERDRDSLRALLRQTRHHALLPRGLEDVIDAALEGK